MSSARHGIAIETADHPRGVDDPHVALERSFTTSGKFMSNRSWPRRLVLATMLAAASAAVAAAKPHDSIFSLPDHFEFDATVAAAFQPDSRGQFPIELVFHYPAGGDATLATWQVDVVAPHGKVVQRWIGQTPLANGEGRYRFIWNGKDKTGAMPEAGFYTVRLRAVPSIVLDNERELPLAQRAARSFRLGKAELIEQNYDVRVGNVAAPRMPAFSGLPHGAAENAPRKNGRLSLQSVPASTLPYTIYYGNLHSQTNHSDGGGPVATCTSEQAPQSAALGPADAYAMMQNQAHGDFLMTSEHNHMFDGSTGTNAAANPATAKALFQSGLTAAANYNAAHAGFLAIYGNEWGVISNGGHMNLINPTGLTEWEYNSSGQLIGDFFTPKSDYAAMYAFMKQQGWIGPFNHPASIGQFNIGGTDLAYDANGDQVMVLAEVLNSSAFSHNTTETETSRNSYQTAFNILLERGYHVAPSTDQDNHCANWGLSYRNRTGVLLPNGTPLTMANFVDALKARRVFAAEDKNGQLILTGNGAIMGQTVSNNGALTLVANYASSNGQTASRVQFFEGVPGSNGTVTQLYEGSGTVTVTPAAGAHFYYAQITQANGDRLWSAPIWVNQGAGGDTTPPTTTASESGNSGTITLSATASDDVGVSNVEFYVDGVLKGSDASSPYSIPLDSTTLSNASHTLTVKAYDAAGNIGTSTAVSFSINNAGSDTSPPSVTASESGSSGAITLSASATDNVGVTKVEFYVDGSLKGTDTASPFTMSLDSTTLSNASHALTAKAYDAMGNVGTSTAVNFTVSNPLSTQFNEVESNGAVTSANVVAHSYSSIVGTMGNTTDKDYFALSLAAGETVKIDMTGPSGNDYDLYLVNAAGTTLKSSAGGTSTETLTYTNGASAATVYAEVISYSGSSTTVPYTLALTYTAGTTSSELIGNGGFESGSTPWTASSGVIDNSTSQAAHAGSWKAWLDGYGSAHTDTLLQTVSIPAAASSATLSFWLKVVSDETTTTSAFDTLKVQVRNSSGTVLTTLKTYSNLDKGSSYVQRSFDLSAYKGQTVQIYFEGIEGSVTATSFLIDDVSLK
jgi:hypothetical protein